VLVHLVSSPALDRLFKAIPAHCSFKFGIPKELAAIGASTAGRSFSEPGDRR